MTRTAMVLHANESGEIIGDDLPSFRQPSEANNYIESRISALAASDSPDDRMEHELWLTYKGRLLEAIEGREDAEKRLIRIHLDVGEYTVRIIEWLERVVGKPSKSNPYSQYISDMLEEAGYSYSWRSVQKDVAVHRLLNKSEYRPHLEGAARYLAINTLYELARRDIDERTVEQVGQQLEALRNKRPDALGYSEIPVEQRITASAVRAANKINRAIEELPEPRRDTVREIVDKYDIAIVGVIEELGRADDDTLEEVKATGHLSMPDPHSRGREEIQVPIAETSKTDFEVKRGGDALHRQWLAEQNRRALMLKDEEARRGVMVSHVRSEEISVSHEGGDFGEYFQWVLENAPGPDHFKAKLKELAWIGGVIQKSSSPMIRISISTIYPIEGEIIEVN